MARTLDPTTRAAVEHAVRNPAGRSRAAIARELGVSTRTVSRYAEELGLNDPFTTRDTRKATESARDRRRAARSDLADRMLAEADRMLDRMSGPYLVYNFGGKDNTYEEHTLAEPPVEALRSLMTTAAIAVDKSVVIDKHDEQSDDDNADDTLARLFEGLGAAYRVLKHQPDDDPDEEAPE